MTAPEPDPAELVGLKNAILDSENYGVFDDADADRVARCILSRFTITTRRDVPA